MTSETENLVLERLRIMRQESSTRFDQLSTKVDTLTSEIRINNAHVAGLIQSDVLTNQRLTDIENRIQRLERSLDLSQTLPPS
jgi:argininosuccinate lyase